MGNSISDLKITNANLKVYRLNDKINFEWELTIHNSGNGSFKNLFIRENNEQMESYFSINSGPSFQKLNFIKTINEKDFEIDKAKEHYKLTICQGKYEYNSIEIKVNCSVYSDYILSKWVSPNINYELQLIGKTGAGKSSLINSIYVSINGDDSIPARVSNQGNSETTFLKKHIIKGVNIWDSSGIERNNYLNNEVLSDIVNGLIPNGTRLEDINNQNYQNNIDDLEKRSVIIFILKYDILNLNNELDTFINLIQELKNRFHNLEIVVLISHLDNISNSVLVKPFEYTNNQIIQDKLNEFKKRLKIETVYPCINNTHKINRNQYFQINLYNLWLLDKILGQSKFVKVN